MRRDRSSPRRGREAPGARGCRAAVPVGSGRVRGGRRAVNESIEGTVAAVARRRSRARARSG
eukprot:412696-Prymnesium_polylepis.1